MCLFCTSIPATLAIGASITAKQRRKDRQAEEHGTPPRDKVKLPAEKLTLVAAGTLVVASAVYHSQFTG